MVIGGVTDFVYDGLNPAQEQSGSTITNLLTGLGMDEHFRRGDLTNAAFFLRDSLGSTIALTESTGDVRLSYGYEPFGAASTAGSSSTNPLQYTGRDNDGTGLYYYRARYYDPRLSRFLSEDPIGFLGGDVNVYAYVGDNPTNVVDPLGLMGPGAAAALGVALGATAGIGSNQPLAAAALGANFGLSVGLLIPIVPAGPIGAVVGVVAGALQGGATGAVSGSAAELLCGTVFGAIGGGVGGMCQRL